ncbi:MAG TPA: sulfurtransferase TusA family protein [Candidatus Mediterraneibacter merdavium]|nr:sulfurtransferase TusA family protein [Candidatus Mediterraneibacter merdavium]
MKTVDARGLSCPEPVMLTEEAVKSGERPVRVLVSEPHQKMNVEKYAKDHNISFTTEETEDGFAVVIS